MSAEQVAELPAGVLAAPVRVEEEAGHQPLSEDGLLEGGRRQTNSHRVSQTPAFDSPGAQVHDCGGVAPALPGRHVGDAGNQHTIGRRGRPPNFCAPIRFSMA